MSKKKKSDFKKLKVKIGQRKPSNNVTKFSIKTAKIVVPGLPTASKAINESKPSYMTKEKKHLIPFITSLRNIISKINRPNSVYAHQNIWNILCSKNKFSSEHSLFSELGGPLYTAFWNVVVNSLESTDKYLYKLALLCLRDFFAVFGEQFVGLKDSLYVVSLFRGLLQFNDEEKQMRALMLVELLASQCPVGLWHGLRGRSMIRLSRSLLQFADQLIQNNSKIISSSWFLDMSVSLLGSVIYGRRSRVALNELEDMRDADVKELRNGPDIFAVKGEYKCYEENVRKVLENVDDDVVPRLDEDEEKYGAFQLHEFLPPIVEKIAKIGLNCFPVETHSQSSLTDVANATISVMLCLPHLSSSVPSIAKFSQTLLSGFPYCVPPDMIGPATSSTTPMQTVHSKDCGTSTDDDDEPIVFVPEVTKLNKKEKLLRKQRAELDKKIDRISRGSGLSRKKLLRGAEANALVAAVSQLNWSCKRLQLMLHPGIATTAESPLPELTDTWSRLPASLRQRWLALAQQTSHFYSRVPIPDPDLAFLRDVGAVAVKAVMDSDGESRECRLQALNMVVELHMQWDCVSSTDLREPRMWEALVEMAQTDLAALEPVRRLLNEAWDAETMWFSIPETIRYQLRDLLIELRILVNCEDDMVNTTPFLSCNFICD